MSICWFIFIFCLKNCLWQKKWWNCFWWMIFSHNKRLKNCTFILIFFLQKRQIIIILSTLQIACNYLNSAVDSGTVGQKNLKNSWYQIPKSISLRKFIFCKRKISKENSLQLIFNSFHEFFGHGTILTFLANF